MKIKKFWLFISLFTITSTVLLAFVVHSQGGSPQSSELCVIMYHSFLKDSSKSGKYVITPSQFENDIIYLKSTNHNFVSVQDIKNFKDGKAPLPQNPVLITIDDGNYNNYTYIFPLMKKYSLPVLISPIGYWVDKYTELGEKNPAYSIITKDEIKEMYSSHLAEFGNHTYNLHSDHGRIGASKLCSESNEAYQKLLTEDLLCAETVIYQATGQKPCALVYPFGKICPQSYPVAQKMGYNIIFSCAEGLNRISPNEGTYVLKRYNRPSGIDSKTFFDKIYK